MNAEGTTAVQISKKRLNGLEFKVSTHKPRTTKAALLDMILEKAGIPELSDKELEQKLGVIIR